jgi:hypothetical protein
MRFWAAGFGLFVLIAVVLMFLPLSLHPASHLPDDGDALQGLCVLSWVAHQSLRAPLEIFDMNLYYPHPKGLAYSEHLIPQGLVLAFLMRLGAGSILAANVLAAASIVAIALALALWARELGLSRTGAATAGLVGALSTATLEEVSRVQMLWMQWIPLGLFFLHRFFRTGSTGAACGFAACFVLQGLSGQYYLISLPVYLAPVLAVYVLLFPERRDLRHALRLAIPLALFSLALVPVEWQYLTLFSHYGFSRPLAAGADLLAYLVPPSNNVLYSWLSRDLVSRTPLGANHHFVGFATWLLAGIGIASLGRAQERRSRLLYAAFAALALGFLVLSAGAELRFGGRSLAPGPFRLLYDYVPFFDYTRVPERLSVYFTLGLALAAGLGASRLAGRIGWKAILPLSILLPLEHARYGTYAAIPVGEEIPAIYHWLAEMPGDTPLVDLPVLPRRFVRFFGYDSYFSTLHWKRIPFGKASFTPPGLEYMRSILATFPSREATRLLQSLGVGMIVYHPHRDPESAATIRRLERDPHFAFVRSFREAAPVARRLDYGGELVFVVRPESPPPARPRGHERPITTDGLSFQTSSAVDPALAVDGRIETGWSTLERQKKGQFFEIDLRGERRLSRISLGFAPPYSEFPRMLSVTGYCRSSGWERLALVDDPWQPSRVVSALVEDPMRATIDLVLEEPALVERVRLTIPETDLTDDLPAWRIPEIRIFDQPP